MDTDLNSAVISRFCILKAKIPVFTSGKNDDANKRVRATTLRYFWCREFGRKRRKHYHVILLLNKDTGARRFHRSFFAGDADQTGMVLLHLEPWRGNGLVHFPGGRLSVNRHHLMLALLPMIRLCTVDVLIPGRILTKSGGSLFSGSSVVMWKRCRKPWKSPLSREV